MTRRLAIPGLSATGYVRHVTHADDRIWLEKNCYVDVMIEMLHALGVEPLAALGFCAAIDFEGDNFTFYKPNHEELRLLFGIDIQEMNCWLPLIDHAEHHLGEGKLLSTEANAYWLPDTSGTDYRRNHVKSTIILADIDRTSRRAGYFHNAGYFELEGEDFDALFRLNTPPDPTVLPFFAELVRSDRMLRRPDAELRALAAQRLRIHLERRPTENPIRRFGAQFARELPRLQDRGLAFYHAWAFATTRQLGSSLELLAMHVEWLSASHPALAPAHVAFQQASATAKTFILKAARAVNAKRPFESAPIFDEMASAWDEGMRTLDAGLA